MTFSSQLDARQFLVDKVLTAAAAEGVTLSSVDLRLLLLNLSDRESAAGIPVEALEDPSREFEKRITGLLRSAWQRDQGRPDERRKYREALHRLQGSTHYMLIIASAAIPRPNTKVQDAVLYIILGLAVLGLFLALRFWLR